MNLAHLLSFSGKNAELLLSGDFNNWVDVPLSKPYSSVFLELLDLNNLKNRVVSPTHISGHILDLVLSQYDAY